MEENVMTDRNELSDEALEQVVGGARRTVRNSAASYANVRSYPGLDSENVEYKVYNGESVYTTGRVRYADGYDWYQLDDGNWIVGSLIGY